MRKKKSKWPFSDQVKTSRELQKAFDAFPKVVKLKEKAAKHKKKIMANFLAVKNQIFKNQK